MKFISLNVDPTKDMVMSLVGNNSVVAARASVSGLGAEDPSTVTFTIDEDFPTSFEEWTDADNNVFVKIPTMYRTIDNVTDGQITAFTISTAPLNSRSQPYSVFVTPDGYVLPYVCIGKYLASDDTKLNSVDATSINISPATARTAAQANGDGYQLYDWQFHKLFIDLGLVISQKVNFQDGTAAIDSYIGIEGLTKFIFVDGISGGHHLPWLICYDPSKYIDDPTASSVGYTECLSTDDNSSSSEISKLGYDAENPFANLPVATVVNSDDNTYYCDIIQTQNNYNTFQSSVGYKNKGAGWFNVRINAHFLTTLSQRLCCRPLAPTELHFTLTSNLTQPLYLTQSASKAVTVDWGDGTTPDNPSDLAASLSHTYTKAGDYTVKIACKSGETWTTGLTSGNDHYGLIGKYTTKSDTYPTLTSAVLRYGAVLGDYAFTQCSGLTNVQLPKTGSTIPQYTFNTCNALTELYIPGNITTLAERAVYSCLSLSSLIFAKDLTELSGIANGIVLSAIGTLTSLNPVPPSCPGIDDYWADISAIYVPADSVEAYKAANGWSGWSPWIQAIPA